MGGQTQEIQVGLALPHYDFSVPGERPLAWPTLAGWARRAEDLGVGSLWVSDHLFMDLSPFGGPARRYGCFDPLPTLAALARLTGRSRLGTLTFCTPLRPAAVLAKSLATLDVLSDGRLVVGLGAGWYQPEMAAAGVDFRAPGERVAQLGEAVAVLKGMFGGGPFSFDGRYERTEDAYCLPVPVQPGGPPVWLGGRGRRLVQLAATSADGWNTGWRWSPAAYRRRLDIVEAACARAGRDQRALERSVGLHTLVGEDEADLARRFERLAGTAPPGVVTEGLDTWREGRLVGTVEQVAEQVAAWRALGVSTLILNLGPVPFSVVSDDDLDPAMDACTLAGCRTSERRS